MCIGFSIRRNSLAGSIGVDHFPMFREFDAMPPCRHPLRRGERFLLDRLVAQLLHQSRLLVTTAASPPVCTIKSGIISG